MRVLAVNVLLVLCVNGVMARDNTSLSFSSPRRDYGLSNVTDLVPIVRSSSISYYSNHGEDAGFSTALIESGTPEERMYAEQHFHHIQKRSYNYTNYNWAGLIDFVMGPYTFIDQVAIISSNCMFSTVNYIIVGNIWCYLKDHTTGEIQQRLNSLSFFLGMDNWLRGIGRVVRNATMALFGRFVFDLLVYGPALTFQGLFAREPITRYLTFLFTPSTTQLFMARAFFEGASSVMGWIVWSYVASTGVFAPKSPATPKPSVVLVKREANETAFDGVDSVEEKIEGDFARIVDNLSKREAPVDASAATNEAASEIVSEIVQEIIAGMVF